MRIPNKLKIGAHTFAVIRGHGLAMDDNNGKASQQTMQIFIRDDIPTSLQEETLIHEAYHVIRQILGSELKDDDQEEQHVQSTGHLLYLFLRDNNLVK